jgi:hypothetical protein
MRDGPKPPARFRHSVGHCRMGQQNAKTRRKQLAAGECDPAAIPLLLSEAAVHLSCKHSGPSHVPMLFTDRQSQAHFQRKSLLDGSKQVNSLRLGRHVRIAFTSRASAHSSESHIGDRVANIDCYYPAINPSLQTACSKLCSNYPGSKSSKSWCHSTMELQKGE